MLRSSCLNQSEGRKPFKLPRGLPAHSRIELAPSVLNRITDTYDQGRYIDAYRIAEEAGAGSLQDWKGVQARVWASRLASHLGADRLSFYLICSAIREDPAHPEAFLFFQYCSIGLYGPLQVYEKLQRTKLEDFPLTVRCDLLALKGRLLASFRDFDRGLACLEEAFSLHEGERPWLLVEKSYYHAAKDELEAALDCVMQGLEQNPVHRPSIQQAARLLYDMRKDDEAIELLTKGCAKLQSISIAHQLSSIHGDLDQYEEALRFLDLGSELSIIADPHYREWSAARAADYLHGLNRLEEAREKALEAGGEFYDEMAARLPQMVIHRERIKLDVSFVKQAHRTCGPASLAALCGYWKLHIPQEDIVDAICYDGTFDHAERAWASGEGAYVREFRVTWEVTRNLLLRGIPFALATSEILNAHLQIVCGFDEVRQSILIRDPGWRFHREFNWAGFIEHYEPTGPRGLLILPAEKEGLVEDIDLPDAEFYDDLHNLNRALHCHRRTDAFFHLEEMRKRNPRHFLTLNGERSVAAYDGNIPLQLEAVRSLRQLYPNDGRLIYAELRYLASLGNREQRLQLLEEVATPGSDPAFYREYGVELSGDARNYGRALTFLRRASRSMPQDAATIFEIAGIYWSRRQFEEAFEFYRLAACCAESNGNFAMSYFLASRHLRRKEEALSFLQSRFARFGRKDAEPACTLFDAFERMDRSGEGLHVLEEARALRPNDGELALAAAERFVRSGEAEKGAKLLAEAEVSSSRIKWLRCAAELARAAGDPQKEIGYRQEVLEIDPLAMDSHRAIARITAQQSGVTQVLERLRTTTGRWPEHLGLMELLYHWLAEADDLEPQLDQLSRIVSAIPNYAWARRERALLLSRMGRHDEALAEAAVAIEIEPGNSASHSIQAQILENAGKEAEASVAYRTAIEHAIDNSYAIERYVALANGEQKRREALALIHSEIVRQPLFGQGLSAYYHAARPVLSYEELEEQLSRALEARPDLWDAWNLSARHQADAAKFSEALKLAQTLCERFPLLPGSWVALARIQTLTEDFAAAIESYRRALSLNPDWGAIARTLSDLYLRLSRIEEAEAVIQSAMARDPVDAPNYGYLAALRWRTGDHEKAIAALERALELAPGYPWAWDELRRYSEGMGRSPEVASFARRLTRERPGDARAWRQLAASLDKSSDFEERLAALNRAIKLAPRNVDAHVQKVILLADEKRFGEAIEACDHSTWQGAPPLELQGRKIWLQGMQGETGKAIAQMEALLREHPYFEWGWRILLEMFESEKRFEEGLKAIPRLAKLVPHDCTIHGWSADFRLKLQRRSEAKEDLRKAISISPEYTYGLFTLFKLCLADGEFEEAEKLLTQIRIAAGLAAAAAMKVRFHLARKEKKQALLTLREVFHFPDVDGYLLNELRVAFENRGWKRAYFSLLYKEAKRGEKINGAVAGHCAYTLNLRKKYFPISLLKRWHRSGIPIDEALVYKLDRLSGKAGFTFRRLLRNFKPILRAHTPLWGKTGYLLANAEKHGEVVEWLQDWRERTRIESWMLANLVISLLFLKGLKPAAEVSYWALQNCPHEKADAYHHSIAALDAALQGSTDTASEHLTARQTTQVGSVVGFVAALAESIIAVQSSSPLFRTKVFRESCRSIRKATPRKCSPVLRALRSQVAKQLRESSGAGVAWYEKLFPFCRLDR